MKVQALIALLLWVVDVVAALVMARAVLTSQVDVFVLLATVYAGVCCIWALRRRYRERAAI